MSQRQPYQNSFLPDNRTLQGRVVYRDPGQSLPDSGGGWSTGINVLDTALNAALLGAKAYASSAENNPAQSINLSPLDLPMQPTSYHPGNQSAPVKYQQIPINLPQPIGQQAAARVEQLQAQASQAEINHTSQKIKNVLNQLALSRGLPTYEEFIRQQQALKYPAPPNPGLLGVAQFQASQATPAPWIQEKPFPSSVNPAPVQVAPQQAQTTPPLSPPQNLLMPNQHDAPSTKAKSMQTTLTVQALKTEQDALIQQAFRDPHRPGKNIIEQAQEPERLDERKLGQVELNLAVLKGQSKISAQQAQELAVAAKLAVSQNWLRHDGRDQGDGHISYRGVTVPKAQTPLLSYADAKHYWDTDMHLNRSQLADAASKLAQGAYNFLIGDDIHTLQDPKASLFAKTLAGVSIASNFIPGAWVEKAGVRFIEKLGGKFLVRLVGKEEAVLVKLAEKGLNPEQIRNYKRMLTDKKKIKAFNIYHLPDGGKVFEGIMEAHTRKDSHTIWQKFVDVNGKTTIFGHLTEYKDGKLLHWHEDFPNKKLEVKLEGTDGTPYLEHLRQILKSKKG